MQSIAASWPRSGTREGRCQSVPPVRGSACCESPDGRYRAENVFRLWQTTPSSSERRRRRDLTDQLVADAGASIWVAIQKSEASRGLVRYAYGMVPYPAIPQPVPQLLRMMNL